ncbi:MAG: hypothetical protein Fur0010_28030 [Bdellovibrio sp.]
MSWQIRFTKKMTKNFDELPEEIKIRLWALIKRMELFGPYLEFWDDVEKVKFKNYGKLQGMINRYHCHIKKGQPTYVVCWEVHEEIVLVEIYYVGSHEKAPY